MGALRRPSGTAAMKDWLTASELAGLALPGLPKTEHAFQIAAKREGWQWRRRSGRGGGWEYHASSLPKTARDALAERMLADGSMTSQTQPHGAKLLNHRAISVCSKVGNGPAWKHALRSWPRSTGWRSYRG